MHEIHVSIVEKWKKQIFTEEYQREYIEYIGRFW